MTFIGLDPGTHFGWAILRDDGSYIASGVWNLSPGRHEGGGMRFLRLRKYLLELESTWPHELLHGIRPRVHVAYEEVRRHMGTDAAHIYGGCVAVITAYCEEASIPYRGIPVGTIKKAATGKGNASKAEMVLAARQRWAREGAILEDEADALWIAETLRTELVVENFLLLPIP